MHQVAGAANKCRGPGDRSKKKELSVQQAAGTRTVALTRSGRVLSRSNSIQLVRVRQAARRTKASRKG